MDKENERRAAIQRLALQNGFKLDMERINRLAAKDKMEHEENLRRIENERQHNKDLAEKILEGLK